jgi:hypothetical protein
MAKSLKDLRRGGYRYLGQGIIAYRTEDRITTGFDESNTRPNGAMKVLETY